MEKSYTHPEIIIRIIGAIELNIQELLDKETIEATKINRGQEAEEMLKNLFPRRQEYGVIQSHFNTEKLSSKRYKNFQEWVIKQKQHWKLFKIFIKNYSVYLFSSSSSTCVTSYLSPSIGW